MRLSTTVLTFVLVFGSFAYSVGVHGWTREAGRLGLMLYAGWLLLFGVLALSHEGLSRLRAYSEGDDA